VISWEDAVSIMLGDSSKGFVITPRKKKELTDKICSAIRKVPCSLDFSAHNPDLRSSRTRYLCAADSCMLGSRGAACTHHTAAVFAQPTAP